MRFPSYFEKKLLIIFLGILSGIATLAIKTYKNNLAHDQATLRVEHTKDALYNSVALSRSVKEMESGVRAYIITGDSTFLIPFMSDPKSLFAQVARLQALTGDNPVQQTRIRYLQLLIADKISAVQHSIDLRRIQGFRPAQAFIKNRGGIYRTQRIDSLLNRIEAEEAHWLKLRQLADEKSSYSFTVFYIVLISVLVFALTSFFIALWRNLSARRKAEASLKESRDLLQSIIDNTTSVIYVKNLEGQFTLINNQFKKMFHAEGWQAIGKTAADLLSPPNARQQVQTDERVVQEGRLIEVEERLEIHGQWIHFLSIKFPLRDQQGTLYAIGNISTNITEVITKQQLQKQREIAATTIEAQEKERNYLGRELHDNVNQLLTYAKLCLEVAEAQVDLREPFLEKSKVAILNVITEIRNLSHSLTVPSFYTGSFKSS